MLDMVEGHWVMD